MWNELKMLICTTTGGNSAREYAAERGTANEKHEAGFDC